MAAKKRNRKKQSAAQKRRNYRATRKFRRDTRMLLDAGFDRKMAEHLAEYTGTAEQYYDYPDGKTAVIPDKYKNVR